MAEFESTSEIALDEDLLQGSDIAFNLLCDQCDDDDVHTEAVGFCVQCNDYLCAMCLKAHRKNKASKLHDVKNKEQMPRTKPKHSVTATGATEIHTEKCYQHPGESIMYFCSDHQRLGCTLCIAKDHGVCKGVGYIPDLTDGLVDSREYKQLGKELKTCREKFEHVLKESKGNVVSVEQNSKTAFQAIDDLERRTLAHIKRFTKEIYGQAEVLKLKDVLTIDQSSDTINIMLHRIEDVTKSMKRLRDSGRVKQLFILLKGTQEELLSWHSECNKAKTDNTVMAYWFKLGHEMQLILDDHEKLGTLQSDDYEWYEEIT